MLSEKDKKILSEISLRLKSIAANIDNLKFIYKIIGEVFRFCNQLGDIILAENIRACADKIKSTTYKEEIQNNLKSIFISNRSKNT